MSDLANQNPEYVKAYYRLRCEQINADRTFSWLNKGDQVQLNRWPALIIRLYL
jgi:hypothetical protein